jgi:arsenite oxidase small subunit
MKRCDRLVDVGRRKFLSAAAAAVVSSGSEAAPANARVDYPSNRLANMRDLKTDAPLPVAYPDKDAPVRRASASSSFPTTSRPGAASASLPMRRKARST